MGYPSLTEYRVLVPDLSGRLGRSQSWATAGSSKEVLAAVVAAAEHRGGRTEAMGESEAELVLGSRSTYRMLGMVSPVRSRPIRLHIATTAESPGKVRVAADATSDVGWYLVNVNSLTSRQFKKAFDQLFHALRVAVPEIPD